MAILRSFIHNPRVLLRPRHILLLSHMRANTSLFGQILGDHPEIEGYYEMHMGYFSWKSLWRQRLNYFLSHDAKPGSKYIFDKILHNGHPVVDNVLKRHDVKLIFMLREPEQSVKSLVSLYRVELPRNPEATVEGAVDYYLSRLMEMQRMARPVAGRYTYLDAESLLDRPEQVLARLSTQLELASPLSSSYTPRTMSGKRFAGDNSARLASGAIERVKSNYESIELSESQSVVLQDAYHACRQALVQTSMGLMDA
ncbi:MAG: hypothetical protein IV093_00570 [Rubrivivax sp.]|nr:hypothetical protein [Rubrivivax sp.]